MSQPSAPVNRGSSLQPGSANHVFGYDSTAGSALAKTELLGPTAATAGNTEFQQVNDNLTGGSSTWHMSKGPGAVAHQSLAFDKAGALSSAASADIAKYPNA